LASEPAANPDARTTNIVASVFGAAALAAILLSVFVMASRPWGCSASSQSSAVTCDWTTSRVIAAVWLAAGLVVSLIAWKRWKLPLAITSAVLLVVGFVSVLGIFSLAPAALWFGCAMWLWAQGRRSRVVLSGVATIVLLYLAMNGVIALFVLYFTPI
jgi:hypothetical protein